MTSDHRGPPPRVTLRDVAQAAGVSTAAVSFALNDGPGVSGETRERVRRLAAELGYRPNVSARALAKGRTGLLAVAPSVLPEVTSYLAIDYLSEVVSGAMGRATALGHPVVVAPAMSTPALWDSLPVDGVVVVDPKAGDQHVVEVLARGIPLVTVDRDPSHPDGWFVDSGVAQGTRALLDHLWEKGARRVAVVSWEMEDAFRSDTESAYQEWASARGMPASSSGGRIPAPASTRGGCPGSSRGRTSMPSTPSPFPTRSPSSVLRVPSAAPSPATCSSPRLVTFARRRRRRTSPPWSSTPSSLVRRQSTSSFAGWTDRSCLSSLSAPSPRASVCGARQRERPRAEHDVALHGCGRNCPDQPLTPWQAAPYLPG